MNHPRLARWCLVLALAACGLAAGTAQATPAAPASPAAAPVQPATTSPGLDADAVKELKEQVKALEDRERSNYAMVIETQRKSVDWWLGGISGLIALLAFAGAIIPYVFTQSERGRLALAQAQTDKTLSDARKALDDIQKHAATAAQASQDTQKVRDEAKLQLAAIKAGKPVTPEESARHQKAATQVLSDPEADDLSKLRALAVKADEANDAALASHLWQAVAAKAPEDATALFNAAYWLQESLSKQTREVSPAEWQSVSALYEANCARDPQSDSALNNWGHALDSQAQAFLAGGDLSNAQALWALAREKYQLGLAINGAAYDLVSNLGSVLLHEAAALDASGEQAQSSKLLHQARERLQETAAQNASGAQAVAYNLACTWARLGDVTQCIAQLQVAQAAGKLPDSAHLDTDPDLAAVRSTPEYQAWRQGLPAPWSPAAGDSQPTQGVS